MKTLKRDVAVIGVGSAGMNAYRAARSQNASVITIERNCYGTTCARVGCMPSKLLISSAESMYQNSISEKFGIIANPPKADGKAIFKRVQSERDRFVGFVKAAVLGYPEEDRIMGQARFLSPNTLQVDDNLQIEAKSIVIATGSVNQIPPFLKDLELDILTNETVFELSDLPESIAVFGTGVIALELGQAFHHLGVSTTIFGRSGNPAQLTDPQVKLCARNYFESSMDYLYNIDKIQCKKLDSGRFSISWLDKTGKTHQKEFEKILCATGRVPATKELGLENTGLLLNAKGIPEFNPLTGQCGDSSIFIAGDVTNTLQLLHEASDEGQIAGKNAALYPNIAPGKRRTPLSITFTRPQIALCGADYASLKDTEFFAGEIDWSDQGRSRIMADNIGISKIYADRAGKILGAEHFHPRAEHFAHLIAWAVQAELTVNQLLDMPFYHPVMEEGIRTALRDLKKNCGV